MQTGNMGYHANIEQNTLPKWNHSNDGGGGMMNNNSSGARVLEVASPDLHLSNERIRRPSGGPVGQGRPGYPSSNNAPRMMHDRRRCVSVCVSLRYTSVCVPLHYMLVRMATCVWCIVSVYVICLCVCAYVCVCECLHSVKVHSVTLL